MDFKNKMKRILKEWHILFAGFALMVIVFPIMALTQDRYVPYAILIIMELSFIFILFCIWKFGDPNDFNRKK